MSCLQEIGSLIWLTPVPFGVLVRESIRHFFLSLGSYVFLVSVCQPSVSSCSRRLFSSYFFGLKTLFSTVTDAGIFTSFFKKIIYIIILHLVILCVKRSGLKQVKIDRDGE